MSKGNVPTTNDILEMTVQLMCAASQGGQTFDSASEMVGALAEALRNASDADLARLQGLKT